MAQLNDQIAVEAKLGQFWGNPKQDKVAPSQWLATASKLYAAQNWTDAHAFNVVRITLQGDASEWFQEVTNAFFGTSITTWAQFREHFAKRYDFESLQVGTPYPVIKEIIQGPTESVQTFNSRIMLMNIKLLKHCTINHQYEVADEDLAGAVVLPEGTPGQITAWDAIPIELRRSNRAILHKQTLQLVEASI